MTSARLIRVRGVVQGVGFRPYVFRLAHAHALTGWVLNGDDGVQIHVEGPEAALAAFERDLPRAVPPAAAIAAFEVSAVGALALDRFEIRESRRAAAPTTRISPDLPVCERCLRELFDPADRRHGYPYINCTECGPRYSIVRGLPYDRAATTMADWPMCDPCAAEYQDPGDRRFHAQPTACRSCGPHYSLRTAGRVVRGDADAIAAAAALLRRGAIVAVKGIGGYHLACDAGQAAAVAALRERKFRKEKPFAVMTRDLAAARDLVELGEDAEFLLTSSARPIVVAPARVALEGVAPGIADLGVMLPYAPLHHLLFAAGAPPRLVMTSGNRSSEPIARTEDEAFRRLDGIADAWLAGERPIARRVDDSVVRPGPRGPVMLRRSRGYAPGAVARLRAGRPLLAVGADLKNTIALVVDGDVFVSPHVGDLVHADAFDAFTDTASDLLRMYDLAWEDVVIAHDAHPQYASAGWAAARPARAHRAVQHHRAHVASVLAERGATGCRVVGVAFDGTGWGDDGSIWGGEIFVGSVDGGFDRTAWLLPAWLPGGDAAAQYPAQAAAGFVAGLPELPDLTRPPFSLPARYAAARRLVASGLRTFRTTSAGRLFDTAAALAGYTGPVSYEGQAAIWFEQLARRSTTPVSFACRVEEACLDHRGLLAGMVAARLRGDDPADAARAFHRGLALGIGELCAALSRRTGADAVVLSGGVFQNALLLEDVTSRLEAESLPVWTNRCVPPNDGGISLGQAALATGQRNVA